MTCIVGYIDRQNGNVIIGGDSASIDCYYNVTQRKNEKVFYVGEFVIGCVGSFRMMQLLQFSLELPKVDKSIFEYMCTDFIKVVRQCFKDGGYLQTYDSGGDKTDMFLVGYKNNLFRIDEDFQVAETIRGYDAIGCGSEYALGSIFLTNETNPVDIIVNALRCAEHFSGAVKEPFKVCQTQQIQLYSKQ